MSSHHPYHHPPRLGIIFFCCCIRCHYSAIDVSECHLERIAYSFSLVSLHFTTSSTSAVAAGCLCTQKSFAFSLVGAAREAVVMHTYITTQQFSSHSVLFWFAYCSTVISSLSLTLQKYIHTSWNLKKMLCMCRKSYNGYTFNKTRQTDKRKNYL